VLHKLTITPLRAALNAQSGEARDWIFLTVSDAVEAVKTYEPPVKPRKLPPPPPPGDDSDDSAAGAREDGARGEP
jgi:hypothetical protein